MVIRDKAAETKMMASPTLSSPDPETEVVEATRVFAVTATNEDIMKMIASRRSLIMSERMLRKKKTTIVQEVKNT